MSSSPERITVHNLADLKNTSDDAIPNYLNSLKFKQDHSLVNTRLALGYSAFFIAGACFLWDYKLGFENTKLYTAIAVALYTFLNGILTFWITFIEKGIVYSGTAPNGSKITISTTVKKNVPTYYVVVELKSKDGARNKIEFSRSFTEWFDEQGRFVALPFQTMFATTVPAIGVADPKRAAPASEPISSDLLDSMDAQTLDALAAAETSGAQTGSDGKKSKRRKA